MSEHPTVTLDEQHWHTIMALLIKAYPQPSSRIVSAGIGYIYARKGEECVDRLGRPRSRLYGSPDDDVIIAVAIRVSRHDARSAGVLDLEDSLLADREQAAEQEVAQASAALAAAEERRRSARQQRQGTPS